MRTLIFLLLAFSLTAQAGTRTSGGGSYVVIDGNVVVADPYYAGVPAGDIHEIKSLKFEDFPEQLQAYVRQFHGFLSRQGLSHSVLAGILFPENPEYFLVPPELEDKVPCRRYLPELNRPVDGHFQYGCTIGRQTYLFQDKFEKAPMKQQAYALLHERLWALSPRADQEDVARFATLSSKLFERFQRQVEGEREPLSAAERDDVPALYVAGAKLGIRTYFFENSDPESGGRWHFDGADWDVNREFEKGDFQVTEGGAVVQRSCVKKLQAENSFLGLGTLFLTCDRTVRVTGSVVVGTDLSGATYSVKDSRLVLANIYPRFTFSSFHSMTIRNSTLSANVLQPRIENLVVEGGVIEDSWLNLGYSARLQGSKSSPFRIRGFRAGVGVLELVEGATVENVKPLEIEGSRNYFLDMDFGSLRVGKGSGLRNITFHSSKPAALRDDSTGLGVYVRPRSRLENGTLVVPIPCNGKDALWNQLNGKIEIGREGATFSRDLGGKTLKLGPGCQMRVR